MNTRTESKEPTSRKRKTPWLLLTTITAAVALVALIMWPGAPATSAAVSADATDVVVYKTATCGCCGTWVAHLQDAGLEVSVVNVSNTQDIQSRVGVPRNLGSCHTAVVGNHWVEGHVPADLVQRLIAEKPDDVRGIAVPGMVMGSPGMESPNPVEYDIVAYDADGHTTVYATRQGQSGE
jgi:hypothetical protein